MRRTRFEKPSPPTVQVRDDLGQALDGLNAWGCLEKWSGDVLKPITCFGPGVFRGYLPSPWVGVLMWYKKRGYYHYSTLYIIGIWAIRAEETVNIVVGSKEAEYSHPIFNAEGYFRRMQSEFRTFYNDDGAPPLADHCTYSHLYDPTQRLEMRQAVARIIDSWAGQI